MTVKKSYEIGDTVWVYFDKTKNTKPNQGKIIHKFQLKNFTEDYYIVSIPTEIEPLLEVRTWQNISQDEYGPVGLIREAVSDINLTKRFLAQNGLTLDVNEQPNKKKRTRYFSRKKKK